MEVNGYTIRPSPNLERATLTGANFEGANLEGANLNRASADVWTVWPEGFDPEAGGVFFP